MPGPAPEQSKTPPSRPRLVALFICANALLVAYSLHVFYWTPSPLGADAPAGAFSEARARRHVQVLTEEIGLRSVSTPGLQQAHNYIWDFCQQLQQKALDLDITVQAEFETYTGSFSFDFVGERFINAYHNISNIILHISKKGHQQDPAVLLVAHHDSPVGSPGAGDDASNIGVMMELAANMVADPDKLSASPVMFLFSGAEEPLCQSAAAFMQHSPWVSRVGVFINLESIGPGGAPIVFQHAGAWVIEAYGKGARYPRGAIAAQDVFDAGLVLGDTDYRQLSYRHRGGLPGIDIAYLLSGAAYHTDRDTLDAIRPGVLQETGETLTGAVRSLAEALATARQQSPDSLQDLLGPKDHKRMFLSLGGRYMLTYSLDTAMMLHNVPLIFTLTAPWTLRLMNPAWSLPASEGLMAMLYSLLVSSWTLIAVLVLPAGLGALRAWASGKAMVWFANHYIVLLTYCPLAVAILLLPWSRMDYSQGRGKQLLAYHVLGAALLNSILASVLTRFGIGLSMIFGLWGAAGAATGCIVAQGISVSTLLGTLLSCAWPIYTCSETAVVMAVVLMSRMSLTGHVFIAMGDAIVGVLLGLGAVSLSGCCLLPVLQALIGRSSRKLAALLAVTAVIMSLAVSLSEVAFPYSRDMPKRLMLGHVHYTAAAVDAQQESVGPVPMTVVNSSWVVAGSDSNSAGMLAEAMGFNLSTAQVATGNEWGMIYPVSKLLDLVLFPAKPSVGVVEHLPHVQLVNQRTLNQQEQSAVAGAVSSIPGEVIELDLEVFTEKPCWGTLRLFGADMVSWSITPGVWTDAATFLASEHGGSGSALISKNRAEGLHVEKPRKEDRVLRSLVVKWTNEHQQGPLQWPLKVRVARSDLGSAGQNDSSDSAGSDDHRPTGLTVELQVGYVERTAALAEIEARMPEWSTLSYEATTYISKWDF